jgi:hypothetical protein
MLRKLAFFTLACILSWWPMMAFHELGHILAALATGGTVTHVELLPWAFSRTDISPNPSPLTTVWAGPIIGVLLPLCLWLVCHAFLRVRMSILTRTLGFFTGFCLIANGAYISLGSFDKIGDAGEMLRLGTPPLLMHTFGGICLTAGLLCWHIISKPKSP